MKILALLFVLVLTNSIGLAQSDCVADQCGSIPYMGAFDDPEWNSDLFMKFGGNGLVYLRLRPVPANPYLGHKFAQLTVSDGSTLGAYDLIQTLWGDAEYDGAILIDFATYDDPISIEVLPLLRKNNTFAGLTLSYLIEPGCHTVPAPWSGGSTSISFQVYNPSEIWHQTMTVNGGEVAIGFHQVIYFKNIGHSMSPPEKELRQGFNAKTA